MCTAMKDDAWNLQNPKGPSTQYLRTLVPKVIRGMVFGIRVFKSWVLGPFGQDHIWHSPVWNLEPHVRPRKHLKYLPLGLLLKGVGQFFQFTYFGVRVRDVVPSGGLPQLSSCLASHPRGLQTLGWKLVTSPYVFCRGHTGV